MVEVLIDSKVVSNKEFSFDLEFFVDFIVGHYFKVLFFVTDQDALLVFDVLYLLAQLNYVNKYVVAKAHLNSILSFIDGVEEIALIFSDRALKSLNHSPPIFPEEEPVVEVDDISPFEHSVYADFDLPTLCV